MNSITGLVFLYLLPFVLAVKSGHITSCSQEYEISQGLNIIIKTNLTSRPFYGFDARLKESFICQRQEKLQDLKRFRKSAWVSLIDELERKQQCKFDETEWSSLKKSLELVKGQRITKTHPDVYVIPDFLTLQQCQELIELHEKISSSSNSERWSFATTRQLLNAVYKASLSPTEYNISDDSQKTCDGGTLEGSNIGEKLAMVFNFSSSVLVPRGESLLVDLVEKKIQQTIGLPRTNAFHTQLIKYQVNSEYKAHTDCHHIENDRMATIIIYLTDVEEGGGTIFPLLNKTVKPKRGMAVVWKNLDKNGQCDVLTTHVAGRVNKGRKYIYQKWFHEEPILPQHQHTDYIFCDLSQSCRQYIYNKSTEIAVQYMNQGQQSDSYRDALKYYEQALQHQPLHSPSLILYADALNALGRSREALPYLLNVLKMHSRNKDAIDILRSVVEDSRWN